MKCTKWIALLGIGALSLTGIPQAASAATAETSVCVNKKTGDMRAVKPVKNCKKTERRLVLNSQGTAGEPGPTGAQGPQGAQGATGAAGSPGSNGASQWQRTWASWVDPVRGGWACSRTLTNSGGNNWFVTHQ